MIALWLKINLIISCSYLIMVILNKVFRFKNIFEFEKDSLNLLAFTLIFTVCSHFSPVEIPAPPIVHRQLSDAIGPSLIQLPSISQDIGSIHLNNETFMLNWQLLITLFIFIGFVIWLLHIIKDLVVIRSILKKTIIIKSFKNIRLYMSQDLKSPCSLWIPGSYIALFPEHVMVDKTLFSHALSHELQHHRQGDTQFLYFLELFKSLFYINPFTHLWIKRLYQSREIKCDMEVLKRKKYNNYAYGNTLVDVINLKSGKVLNRTWAMASLTTIKRRIEMIINAKKQKMKWSHRLIGITLTILFNWQAVAASHSTQHLQEMGLKEVREILSQSPSSFPIEVNEAVLKWLNYFITDPKGKAYMVSSLNKMNIHNEFILQKLKDANMPLELLAVPLMESGYNNSIVSINGAAGIWQFMPQTAKRYGLQVNSQTDERLDIGKLTDTAIAYYKHLINIKEFNHDWQLALLAYNSGENGLRRAMENQGTKDPWSLENIGDKDYLAKIMAGIILVKKEAVLMD